MDHEEVYYLMHRNDIVTTLSFDKITGNVPAGDQLLKIAVNSFKSKETELLKYVKNVSLIDLENMVIVLQKISEILRKSAERKYCRF